MNHLHWMKLYIGDELSNTSHMMPAEFGSYIFLKMHYWRFGCLPTDDVRLARIAKVSIEQWMEIKPSIGPLFDDEWRDPKLEAQREEAEEKHKARVEAGRKGGMGKKQSLSNATSKTKAQLKQPEPEPEPDSYPDPKSGSESEPEVRAYDKGRKGTYTRESMFTPFPIPASAAEGRSFLVDKGIPQPRLDECVRLIMGGNFSPYELEGVVAEARKVA